ncbi:MAG TPA: ATP-binding protein, partial [Burkholderiaceae bacterium]
GQLRVASGLGGQPGATMVGRGVSRRTSRLPSLGWTTLVLEPEARALEPVSRMAAIFEGLLLAVLLAAFAFAWWFAAAIARPIAALTASTRRYRREGLVAPASDVPVRFDEIEVLERGFREMVAAEKQYTRELVRRSKMTMLGELAAVLAHEVRTPLGILRSSAQILQRNRGLSGEERELTTFIESETERLNRLVSTMLDLARPPMPSFVPCDMHELLVRCAHMHELRRAGAGGQRPVETRLAAADPVVEGDPEQLMQVVFNLLNNAAEACGPDGIVRLETADDGDHLLVRCVDSGPGLPAGLAERLFEPFVSGREGGVGLGLAVARQIVVAHGGDIEAGTGELGGASFSLRLPRRRSHKNPEIDR